jgi:Ca-activated chloride channel family protein
LGRNDFRIFDNEIEQPIADFLPIEEPAQFLLLIESGPSVLLFAKNHILAADQLIASVAPDDKVAIATYARSPKLIRDFTADKAVAREELRTIDFHDGFGELNLFASVVSAVEWLARLPGKKTMVLLSTGVDSSENDNLDLLRSKLQIADVRIIAVSLSGDLRRPVRRRRLTAQEKHDRANLKEGFASADKALRELSAATGGRVYFARNGKEFVKAYTEIADLLRHEYSLAFAPTVFDGKVHSLRVEVKRTGLMVDHRPAYVAAVAQ